MGRKHHTEEQIIGILRAAEVVVSKGGTIEAFCRDQKDHRGHVLPLAQDLWRSGS